MTHCYAKHGRHKNVRIVQLLTKVLIGAMLGMGCSSQQAERDSPATSRSAQLHSATQTAALGNHDSSSAPVTDSTGKSRVTSGATGNLVGVVRYDGPVPRLPLLVKQGDTSIKDHQYCAAHDVPDQSLLVNTAANNGLANVFVYLVKAPRNMNWPVPDEPVVLDQKGCIFLPHAMLVRVGQTVLVKSNDATLHNVHTFPMLNPALNSIVVPNDRMGLRLVYQHAEAKPVAVKCDIHPWMRAYQLVLDHPFMAISDSEGMFQINDLPAGKHSFRIWHERADILERSYEVDIKAGKTSELSLSFSADKFGMTSRPPNQTVKLSSR